MARFSPKFFISAKTAKDLMRIEAAKERVKHLPLSPMVIASLRETARLVTAHYSTMIEGNSLNADEVRELIQLEGHFPGRERDEREVKGYYAALEQIEKWCVQKRAITEGLIRNIHALVYEGGKVGVKATPYREQQNVIRSGGSGKIVYMPPEAKDVPELMKTMVDWITESAELPCPIVAGIAHYQFATIHPYMDGNGRTARLLTTYVLHIGGYDLSGLYSLEEYYAKNLSSYYRAISLGPSHNYYEGRAETDMTPWIEYFIEGMAKAFEDVSNHMQVAQKMGGKDQSKLLRKLDPKQRKALELFREYEFVTTAQLADLFQFKTRSANNLCKAWVQVGFLVVVDESRKARKYQLADQFRDLVVLP